MKAKLKEVDPRVLKGNLGMILTNLKSALYILNHEGDILDANPVFLEMFGCATLEDLQFHRDTFVSKLQPLMKKLDLQHLGYIIRQVDLQLTDQDRVTPLLDVAYAETDPASGETLYYGMLLDLSELKKPEEASPAKSFRDPLTGCFNRLYLDEFQRNASEAQRWGCMVLYIDRFKQICDHYGDETAKSVICKTARFLLRYVRIEDAVVRLADDQFVLLLNDPQESTIRKIEKRLRNAAISGAPVSFSLGWVLRKGKENLEESILAAGQCLSSVQVLERLPRRHVR